MPVPVHAFPDSIPCSASLLDTAGLFLQCSWQPSQREEEGFFLAMVKREENCDMRRVMSRGGKSGHPPWFSDPTASWWLLRTGGPASRLSLSLFPCLSDLGHMHIGQH